MSSTRAPTKQVVTFDSTVQDISYAEQVKGSLASNPTEKRLMRSVLEHDEQTIREGKLLAEALNRGIQSLTPNMLFEQMVANYKQAEQLFGKTLLREAAGYEPEYIERNIRIPEFRRELRSRLEKSFRRLREDQLLDKEGMLTEEAVTLAAALLYTEELDTIVAEGSGTERMRKKKDMYGLKEDIRDFHRDRYRDLALRKTIRKAISRQHAALQREDLVSFERESKGKNCLIYAIDASGSMKGEKLGSAKRAGIALAFKAIEDHNRVGLIVFGEQVNAAIAPSNDFTKLLREIMRIQAAHRTDIAATIRKATELFPREKATKHVIIITDALPTAGKKPEQAALEAAMAARHQDITISVVGIRLDRRGEALASKIAEIGKGNLYGVQEEEELRRIVLQDYRMLQEVADEYPRIH